MPFNELKNWIEDLVKQVSGTDWWANGIAIVCAIIGVAVPIVYEMYQRRKSDDEINKTIQESLTQLSTISEELKGSGDRDRSDIDWLLHRKHERLGLYEDMLEIFKQLDELIFLKKEIENLDKINSLLDNLVKTLKGLYYMDSYYMPHRRYFSTDIDIIKELRKHSQSFSSVEENKFKQRYLDVKYRILRRI